MGRTLGLDESSLKTHPMRHVLTMAVGVGSVLRIRYYAVALDPDSIMMLSSDGLHGVVAEEELERILNESPAALQDKCLELIAAANAAGGPDNITVVLIRSRRVTGRRPDFLRGHRFLPQPLPQGVAVKQNALSRVAQITLTPELIHVVRHDFARRPHILR